MPAPWSDTTTLRAGTRVGRYPILQHLGTGGMGWVYLAYDPELDRRVAIKILRDHRRGQRLLSARLLREAQAMARLAHPNVVAVHDVGTWEDRVFVTMEYVPGGTLRAWLQQSRTCNEIVEMFIGAGRGLAAAHHAGLIHRDFKPDNVLVGDDGRARVMDFGLVRANDSELDDDDDAAASMAEATHGSAGSSSALSTVLTRFGAMVGTPIYMAPEQFVGVAVDERSDQFAFCVALHEALWGVRPYVGADLENLRNNVMNDVRVPRPSDRKIPSWLEAIVDRGLSHDPDARWPSMDALLEALASDPSVVRRRRTLAAALLVTTGLAVAGLAAFDRHQTTQLRLTCEARAHASETIWNDARAAALEQTFVESGQPTAAAAWASTKTWINGYAAKLGEHRRDNCLASEVDGSRTPADAELVERCLDDHQAEFETFIDVLSETRGPMIHYAAHAAASLPSLDLCADLHRQAARPPPPPALRERLADLRRDLYRVNVLSQMSEFERALTLSKSALDEAESLGWMSALAQAELGHANLSAQVDDLSLAVTLSEAAFRHAAVAGDASELIDASIASGQYRGRAGEYELAEDWLDTADELIDLAALDRGPQAAQLARVRARVAVDRGQLDRALAEAQYALELDEALAGPNHPGIAPTLATLIVVAHERGDRQGTRETAERQLQILTAAYGPDNIFAMRAYNSVGVNMHVAREIDAALDYYKRAIAIAERIFGPDYYQIATPLTNIALIEFEEKQDLEASRVGFERALGIFSTKDGERAAITIRPLVNLGTIASRQGRHEDALAYFERCMATLEAARDTEFDRRELYIHPSYADALVRAGALERAYPLYQRTLAVAEHLDGERSPTIIRSLLGLATIDIERGQLGEAEAALARIAPLIHEDQERAWIYELNLAHLRYAKGEREAARARVQEIRSQQAAKPRPDKAFALVDLDTWLAAHPE